MDRRVFILSGISGSGKSTLAKYLKQISGNSCEVVSADDFFIKDGKYNFNPDLLGAAHAKCQHDFVAHLNAGVPLVIVDNTNVDSKHFRFYVDEASKHQYLTQRIIVDNINGTKSIHNVPEVALKRQSDRLIASLTRK